MRTPLALAVGSLALSLLCGGCDPQERVVARIERLSDGGPPPVEPEPDAGPGIEEPPTSSGSSGSPVEGAEPQPPSIDDSSCAGVARAWEFLWDTVENDCRVPYQRLEGLSADEIIDFFRAVVQALSTPVDPASVAEVQGVMRCDLWDVPAYLDSSSPPVLRLCPNTCTASKQWLDEKRDEVLSCAASGGRE